EEFMLLANRTVAAHVGKVAPGKTAKAFVYRIHDVPDYDRLVNLADIAAHFGYKIKIKGSARVVNKSINQMIEKSKGKPEEQLLSMLAIR
ncbi:MAG TPA: ribonuclease R, partial [Porphyromonadaceae bacterium]|nr:ribonuclease R [Porphyromonadaceae bacterium]